MRCPECSADTRLCQCAEAERDARKPRAEAEAAAALLLSAMASATPEVIDAIQRRLGPCDGSAMVTEALLALREWREANARGSW